MNKAFKAYDIRGIYNKDFNREDVYKIGFFLPKLLKTDTVLVGRDMRISSPEIFESLTQGITDAGAHVKDAGLTTTPMIYWGTAKFGFEASVQITASHNDKEYNGLKISKANALPVGYDTGLNKLEKMIENETVKKAIKKGTIETFDYKEAYIRFQQSFLKPHQNLSVVADLSNGIGGVIIPEVYDHTVTYLNQKPDGNFPVHAPNPLKEKNAEQLKEEVLKNKADFGVIFDGDADRAVFIDEKANFISPDLMIALLGHHFFSSNKKQISNKVLQDIRTSKSVGEYLTPMGAEIHTWRVGRAYAALKLREIDGIYGGELAGHYYFKDFYYSDSAILAFSLVSNIVSDFKKQGKTLSQLISEISSYVSSGEVNFTIKEKQKAMDAVKNHFIEKEKPTAFYDFDGYRIEYKDWWLNIRPSNTEPYLRFIAESKSQKILEDIIQQVKQVLKPYFVNPS